MEQVELEDRAEDVSSGVLVAEVEPSEPSGPSDLKERVEGADGTVGGSANGARSGRKRKVLAVSSGGGHWVQMLRLAPVFAGHEMVYATVNRAYRCDVPSSRFYTVMDATAWNKFRLCAQALQIAWIVLRERPDVVISTGAAPGYFALRFGKMLGCRTVWIDSIANVERLSMAGKRAEEYADLWLTQWPHLALDSGPFFRGAVL